MMTFVISRILLRCDAKGCDETMISRSGELMEDLRDRANQDEHGWCCDVSGYEGDFCPEHQGEKRAKP